MPGPAIRAVAVMHHHGDLAAWRATLESVRLAAPDMEIVVGSRESDISSLPTEAGYTTIVTPSLSSLVNRTWLERRCHLVVLVGRAEVPEEAFGPAFDLLDGQIRLATVCFLGDRDGLKGPEPSNGLSTATQVSRRLRGTSSGLDPAPIPFATGPVVVLSRHALSAVGPLAEVDGPTALADFSLRARRRGFLDVVDPSTYVAGTGDGRTEGIPQAAPDQTWLIDRHPFIQSLLDHQDGPDADEAAAARARNHDVPLGEAWALEAMRSSARIRIRGLRVIIDASWTGVGEMGTQVQTLALVQALARRPDIERVTVALPARPSAAQRQLASIPKVDARPSAASGDVTGLGPADIVHRPFQPDGRIDVESWAKEAERSAITLLDLIAYSVGTYHPSGDDWVSYRRTIRHATSLVDGVVVISEDVAAQVRMERLGVQDHRLFVSRLGTDHLRGDEAEAEPAALVAGRLGPRFCLVLGANYTHKNRDLAIRAHSELRRRGVDIDLVLAGPSVDYGSSRMTEAVAGAATNHDRIFVMDHVPAVERNWLLRNAEVVLYPTSAEGFGLVPFEAARFGTPTVLVPVGPLAELAAGLPVVADHWSPAALADATQKLLDDPGLAGAHVESTLAAAKHLTWDATADRLVDIYRDLLSRPRSG